jgi:AraC family transcriptional regulator
MVLPMAADQIAEDYKARINRVIDYIEQNLANDFALDELACVAGFSKYHFHRIFRSMMDESLFHFIQRLRLEKAALMLRRDLTRTVTDIALDCGFAGSAAFARSFVRMFGMPATAWRKQGATRTGPSINKSNQRKRIGNRGKARILPVRYSSYNQTVLNVPKERKDREEHQVEIKEVPETTVAYVRYIGPFKGNAGLFRKLAARLFRWAGPRHLLHFPETNFLILCHDAPGLTAEEKLRISVCISVPPHTGTGGEIGKMTIPDGTYACARFRLLASQYEEAWRCVFRSWFPGSGYVPDDRPSFECYPFVATEQGRRRVTVDICVPVRPVT